MALPPRPTGLAIETHDLTRAFPGPKARAASQSGRRVAVDRLTFDVRQGEVLALLGPKGAGKTTTIRLLDGVLRPDSGRSRVLGLDPSVDGDAVRRRTGVLTENAGLDERLTARENLAFAARIRGLPTKAAAARAGALLDQFGMSAEADRQIAGFSTGQRKRVALARALLHDPEVLFLDEPTSGLDPAATRDVVDHIGSLASDHGRTVILCTHFLGEAGKLADRMAVLHHGRLQAFGEPEVIAAGLWNGLAAELDLGTPADTTTLDLIGRVDGVLEASGTATGATLLVRDREVLPEVVGALVGAGLRVYASTPRPPTLEDVYFELEARRVREQSGAPSGLQSGIRGSDQGAPAHEGERSDNGGEDGGADRDGSSEAVHAA